MAFESNKDLRKDILAMARRYQAGKGRKFVPGETTVQYSGTVMGEDEMEALVGAALDSWFGLAAKGREFEEQLAKYLGVSSALYTNSGSSANLIAVSTLAQRMIHKQLKPGDEVVTPATTFPTTVFPLLQNGLVPVFVDSDPATLNAKPDMLEEAITEKTRLVMLPHTMGNPNDMDQIMRLKEKYGFYLIEDNCDALGSTFGGRKTGTFGELGTTSFYPAHHITTGEGGAVFVGKGTQLYRTARSLRDWGRHCYCDTDEKDPLGACHARFSFKLEGVPYDHKYMYSTVGYNLKPTEIQAALGCVQVKRIDEFGAARRRNFKVLYERFAKHGDVFLLPEHHKKADPSWFAFWVTVREGAPFSRNDFADALEKKKIQTRVVFAGNLVKQPAMKFAKYRTHGTLEGADTVARRTLFIGVYPGLTPEVLSYVGDCVDQFVREHQRK